MDIPPRQRTQAYIVARQQHPAWQLLASRRAPLVISCLQTLFADAQDGVATDEATQALAELLEHHANDPDLGVEGTDYPRAARLEIRSWIKKQLLVERSDRLYPTDALESGFRFVQSLDARIMTSSASRLMVVQEFIEKLESSINPSAAARTSRIKRQIAALERELADVEAGHMPIPTDNEVVEQVREAYALAMGLRADFRRVEDSWREADRILRQRIISEQQNRGEVLDGLLTSHDNLLQTQEGRVFHGFHQQLQQSVSLDEMKERIRAVLKHPATPRALSNAEQADLRWLVMRLVKESDAVIRTRARSERDVKGFLKTGLAAEHHRVGAILNDILQAALDIDWTRHSTRQMPTPLPVLAVRVDNLPAIERLRAHSREDDDARELDLSMHHPDLGSIDGDFWDALNGLDRNALRMATFEVLTNAGRPLSLGEISERLPPTHDLETITVWLGMAHAAGLPVGTDEELLDVVADDQTQWRFRVPLVHLSASAIENIDEDI